MGEMALSSAMAVSEGASAMSFVAIACLTPSSQSPVRRPMQTISNATPRTRSPA
jgi:hypothetical protein